MMEGNKNFDIYIPWTSFPVYAFFGAHVILESTPLGGMTIMNIPFISSEQQLFIFQHYGNFNQGVTASFMFDFLILNALQSRKTEQLENISAYISCLLGMLLISALELAGHQNTPDIYDLPAGIIASLLYSMGRLSVIKDRYTTNE